MTRSIRERIVRGIGATAFGQVVNATIQLLSLPIFLSIWGVERYGDWLILTSLASFLSMSDVGFTSVAANEMTMSVGRGDKTEALVVYQSMWSLILTFLTLCILAISLVLGLTDAGTMLPVTDATRSESTSVLFATAIFVLAGLPIGVVNAGYRCDGNFAIGSLFGSMQRTGEFITQVVAAVLCKSLLSVALAGLVARCLTLLVLVADLQRRSPWLRLGFRKATFGTMRRLFVPAISFLGLPLGHALGTQGMVQVVARVLGPAFVVIFSAHRTIANIAIQLMNSINQTVWPEFSAAYGA